MALALAVVIQTAEEREPFCRKGTVPFRQNGPTNVQYLADSFGTYSCVQEIDGQFPNQMVNFATAADRFSFCSLLEGTPSTLNLFRFNVVWYLLVSLFCELPSFDPLRPNLAPRFRLCSPDTGSLIFRRSGTDRARRSSFVTTKVSPSHTAASACSSPGRSRFVPDIPWPV